MARLSDEQGQVRNPLSWTEYSCFQLKQALITLRLGLALHLDSRHHYLKMVNFKLLTTTDYSEKLGNLKYSVMT